MNRDEEAGWPEAPGAGPLGDGRWATETLHLRTVDEVCEAVRGQAEAGRALYPQGGRTALDYGRPPGRPGAAIDVTGLNQVIDYPHADMTITIQAGATVAALRSVLGEHRQRLLIDVPQADRATLGGVYATNASGPRRFGLGRPRDQIIGVSFVTSEGVAVKGGGRVVKNVAGYDFPKLLTGSMGTLGVITQLTLKVRPLPEASALVWLRVPDAGRIDALLAAFDTSATRPVAIELLNPAASRIIGGASSVAADSWVLAVGLEDGVDSVNWQIDRLGKDFEGVDFEVFRDAGSESLWSALIEFQAAEPGPIGCVANLRPSRVAAFVGDLDPERWAVQAHAGNGVVRMQAIGEWTEDQAARAIDARRAAAVRDGGNLIVARCPTAWKDRLRVWGEPRADWALARRVKQALDPRGLMNPGRFVGDI
ncbi:MAG: FAD-binding oxidoreductase [Paludisphaera borealis]|uniref:FAD-binding oxidoreductase n=1 Tax=Paludisphaera borealis TaxID=1387353 RepID=UPI00284EAD35|nr:FAD-binding oxidoreductase [Paludisphaera borealis]MDR3619012.1 FAD-binding oxidoreductase [Paludisphaera borealis]